MSKKAMVTGASEGIGSVIAKKLALEGYQIVGVARNESKLKTAVQSWGQGHSYIVADLSLEADQDRVAKLLGEQHFDLLVNNAGVGTTGKFTEVPLEKQMAMIRLNCEAVTKLSYAFIKQSKSGDALINVSSTLSFVPMPGLGLYCATKSFVTAFSETLWFEQKSRGVFVTALHPGITSTNFQVNSGGKTEDLPKGMAQTPEQVADVAMEALKSRKNPTVISGGKNAFFAGLSRVMPRKSIVKLMGNMSPDTRTSK